ncbi:MAG: RHS repeat-associated core domain-containing protein [Bacilli bacterium]
MSYILNKENPLHIGFTYSNTNYFYLRDVSQNILGIIDANGNVVVKYKYNAYGKLLSTTGSLANTIGIYNSFRYKEYYYDVETQLYWVSSRYYSPELCRWISPDSIDYLDPESINGLNLYAYCGNDPVNKYDPTGYSAILIAIAIGAVLGGIYAGVSAAANDRNILTGILIGAVVGGLTSWITEVASVPLMLLGTFAVGAGGDVASQMILERKSWKKLI